MILRLCFDHVWYGLLRKRDDTITVYRVPSFLWMVKTLTRKREYFTMFWQFVWTDNAAINFDFLSIVHMNVWLWRSDFRFYLVFRATVVHMFWFWIFTDRPFGQDRLFLPHHCRKKNSGADRTLNFNMFRFVARSVTFCTESAAHPPLFC